MLHDHLAWCRFYLSDRMMLPSSSRAPRTYSGSLWITIHRILFCFVMENWQLLMAAFILNSVDLGVLSAFLWYQFSTLYFAWHLCPLIVNRICELIAFFFTGGMLPSLFSIVQVPLSLFSTTVYAKRKQRLQNKLLLAVYCTLLVYEFLVAVLMIKMGRYLKCPTQSALQQIRSSTSQQAGQIAFQMFTLCSQSEVPGCPSVRNNGRYEGSQMHSVVTVEQPDGKKVMLGKVVPSKKVEPENAVPRMPDCNLQVMSGTTDGVATLCFESDSVPEGDRRISDLSELL